MSSPRRSGRAARLAQRAAPPATNPAPPGQKGGLYRPLGDSDMQDIFDTALRLLAELGMGEVPQRLWDDLTAAGAHDLGNGRIGCRLWNGLCRCDRQRLRNRLCRLLGPLGLRRCGCGRFRGGCFNAQRLFAQLTQHLLSRWCLIGLCIL